MIFNLVKDKLHFRWMMNLKNNSLNNTLRPLMNTWLSKKNTDSNKNLKQKKKTRTRTASKPTDLPDTKRNNKIQIILEIVHIKGLRLNTRERKNKEKKKKKKNLKKKRRKESKKKKKNKGKWLKKMNRETDSEKEKINKNS